MLKPEQPTLSTHALGHLAVGWFSCEDRGLEGESYPIVLVGGEGKGQKPRDRVGLSSPWRYLSWMEFVYI